MVAWLFCSNHNIDKKHVKYCCDRKKKHDDQKHNDQKHDGHDDQKPAFVFIDDEGHVKLQFKADTNELLHTCMKFFARSWPSHGIMSLLQSHW